MHIQLWSNQFIEHNAVSDPGNVHIYRKTQILHL